MARKITIEPVTRVEGHGKVTIHLDDRERSPRRASISSSSAASSGSSRAGPTGRPRSSSSGCAASAPSATTWPRPRPWTSSSASDREALPPTAEKMRRLMHYGQMFQSHALHFFHLASPDLLFGDGRRPGHPERHRRRRSEHRDLAVQGVLLRKFGQEIILATAGKKIHGTGAIPGGVNKNLSPEERDAFLKGPAPAEHRPDGRLGPGSPRSFQGLPRKEQGLDRRLRRIPVEPPQPGPQGRRPGLLPRRPAGRGCGRPQGPQRRRLSGLPRVHRRRDPALELHEVPLPQVRWAKRPAGTGSARWPGSTLAITSPRRWPRRSSRFTRPTPTGSPTTCPCTRTGPGSSSSSMRPRSSRNSSSTRTCRGRSSSSWAGSGCPRASGLVEAPRGTLFHHYRINARRPDHDGQPDRFDDEQQRAHEPGRPMGGGERPRRTGPRSPKGC